jgi:acyl carrier protein
VDERVLTERVIQHIGEFLEADVSYLASNSRLSTALPGLDSLKVFEMVLYLEDCFGVKFDESVIQSIDTLGDLTGYINGQLKEAKEPAT